MYIRTPPDDAPNPYASPCGWTHRAVALCNFFWAVCELRPEHQTPDKVPQLLVFHVIMVFVICLGRPYNGLLPQTTQLAGFP